jgi:hypothetical protein
MKIIDNFCRPGLLALGLVLLLAAGCGNLNLERENFPSAAIGDDGQAITLDDINQILDDPELDQDQKRDALRELGLEDPILIDILLS